MSLKIFKEEFNKFLSRGGWLGKGYFDIKSRMPQNATGYAVFENKTRLVGFFEHLKFIGLVGDREKYFIHDDFDIRNVIKFANSNNGSSTKAIEFRCVVASLTQAGFKTSFTSDVSSISSAKEDRVLANWLLPTLKDFISYAKEQDWYSIKDRDSFVLHMIDPNTGDYNHKSYNVLKNIEFLIDVCNDSFDNKKLFSYLYSNAIQDEENVVSLFCEVHAMIKHEPFKKYIRDNIYMAEDVIEKRLNAFRVFSENTFIHSVDKLKLNTLLKEDYRNGILSKGSSKLLEKNLVKDFELELLDVEHDGDVCWVMKLEQFNCFSPENSNSYSFITSGTKDDKPFSITYNKVSSRVALALSKTFSSYVSQTPDEAKTMIVYDSTICSSESDEVNSIDKSLRKKYPNEFDEVDGYCVMKMKKHLATDDLKQVLLLTLSNMLKDGAFQEYELGVGNDVMRKNVVFMHNHFEKTRTFELAKLLNKAMEKSALDENKLNRTDLFDENLQNNWGGGFKL